MAAFREVLAAFTLNSPLPSFTRVEFERWVIRVNESSASEEILLDPLDCIYPSYQSLIK